MANTALNETFDTGLGALSNAWNVSSPVNGAVALTGSSAMMEWATGAAAGHGYGTYTVTAKLEGDQPGAAIVLWPGDNKWPGQEIDIVETTPDGSGREYGTVHWNNNGSDAYSTVLFDGVSSGTYHNYTVVWEPGSITFKVDGTEMGTITSHVPTDYDHGGMNNTIGVMNTSSDTSIAVSNVSFTPLGSETSATVSTDTSETTETASATTTSTSSTSDGSAVDWNAVAAQVTANYETTGHWFL